MPRRFNSTSHWARNIDAAPLTAAPLTMACWYRMQTSGSLGVLMQMGDKDAATNDHKWRMVRSSGGNLQFLAATTSSSTLTNSTATLRANVWEHCLVSASASFCPHRAVLNGVAATLTSVNRVPTGVDSIVVGAQLHSTSTFVAPAGGDIYWPAVWDVQLTPEEEYLLSEGVSPRLIRPQNLVLFVEDDDQRRIWLDAMRGQHLTLSTGADSAQYVPDVPEQVLAVRRRRAPRLYAVPDTSGQTKTVTDAGAASDAIAQLAVALGINDVGSGAETLPGAAAALGVTDTGSAADLLAALSAALALTDSGSAIDTLAALAAALAVSDSATAADAVSIITEALFQITDSGTASDVLAGIVAQLAVAESATGVDAIAGVSTSLVLSDSGVAVDGSPTIAALLALAETASGADAVAVLTEILKQIADSGSAADGVSLSASIALADAATGADTIVAITALLALADSGAGIDVAARFDAAVRIVRLVFSFRRRHAEFQFARRTMQFQLAA